MRRTLAVANDRHLSARPTQDDAEQSLRVRRVLDNQNPTAQRHRLGWALLGAAVAAKLWPVVLVPLALVWSWRAGRLPAALAGLAVAALAFVPFAVLAPHGVWQSLSGQASRPLQVEGLGASLFTTFGHPQIITTHGSQNVAGHGAVAAVFGVLQLAALVFVWVAFARGPVTPERFIRYGAASVCAFIAFGKVLSPQFLLWLLPLVALSGRRAPAFLLLAALGLTHAVYPDRYDALIQLHALPIALLAARDALLLGVLTVLLLEYTSGKASTSTANA